MNDWDGLLTLFLCYVSRESHTDVVASTRLKWKQSWVYKCIFSPKILILPKEWLANPYFAQVVDSLSPLHTVYWDESGHSGGLPVMVLHGGPGGGSQADYRRYFDPAAYRIVQMDQRGCGQSRPHAELEDNNTQALVADIEKLRQADLEH